VSLVLTSDAVIRYTPAPHILLLPPADALRGAAARRMGLMQLTIAQFLQGPPVSPLHPHLHCNLIALAGYYEAREKDAREAADAAAREAADAAAREAADAAAREAADAAARDSAQQDEAARAKAGTTTKG
jgi:hypothetical protein